MLGMTQEIIRLCTKNIFLITFSIYHHFEAEIEIALKFG